MAMADPREGFTAEERALLDSFVVPAPSAEWVDRVMAGVSGEAVPPLPPRRAPGRAPRWRQGLYGAVILSGTVMVTAAAAERGVFGPAAQQQVQAVVAAALAPVAGDRPSIARPARARPVAAAPAAPEPVAVPSAAPGPERIAPVIARLQANPQTAAKVNRYLERRARRQEARGEAPTPPNLAELARQYRRLPEAGKQRLRQQFRNLPAEDQAEIRAILREYRAARRQRGSQAGNPATGPDAVPIIDPPTATIYD